jgi:predicted Zn-dependent protease
VSRYYSLLIALFISTGCASKGTDIQRAVPLPISENSVEENFHKDDLYLLYALDSQYIGNFKLSSEYFEKLYDINHDVIYMHEAIKGRIHLKQYTQIKRLIDKALPEHPNDHHLKRYLAAYYLDKHEFKKAQKILKELIHTDNDENDKLLLASSQLGMGETQEGLAYYEKIYEKNKDPQALLTLINILYSVGQKDKAKRLLHTHVDFIGCDEKLCYKLLDIYQKEQDVNGLLRTAQKLYEKTKKVEFAKIILDIYAYQKDFDSAIAFFEKYRIDDSALLELYVKQKKFTKASKLANSLYKESKDLHFLAQIAMIEYESSPDPKDKALLKSVQKKFEKVTKSLDDPSYNNFYGYILIDHDIDIEKGMKFIKKALAKSPNAPYFIDSLAWGYYKQKECTKAYDTIYPIMIMVKEPEILDHFKTIKACKEGKK